MSSTHNMPTTAAKDAKDAIIYIDATFDDEKVIQQSKKCECGDAATYMADFRYPPLGYPNFQDGYHPFKIGKTCDVKVWFCQYCFEYECGNVYWGYHHDDINGSTDHCYWHIGITTFTPNK